MKCKRISYDVLFLFSCATNQVFAGKKWKSFMGKLRKFVTETNCYTSKEK